MRTLYIIRHAKSSWADPWMKDADRPLNDRGLNDAPKMGVRLKEKGVKPDLIISSPALRAKTTALLIGSTFGFTEKDILIKDAIYEADLKTLYMIVRNIDPIYKDVFIFGHNPTFTYFANDLASVRIDNIPTCGIAAIQFEKEWSEVNEDDGKLVWFDYPKNI